MFYSHLIQKPGFCEPFPAVSRLFVTCAYRTISSVLFYTHTQKKNPWEDFLCFVYNTFPPIPKDSKVPLKVAIRQKLKPMIINTIWVTLYSVLGFSTTLTCFKIWLVSFYISSKFLLFRWTLPHLQFLNFICNHSYEEYLENTKIEATSTLILNGPHYMAYSLILTLIPKIQW